MDGLDGLVGGCMFFAVWAVAYYLSAPLLVFSLVGSLFGFLIWNWAPAKVFMGDVGSLFLGSIFAGLLFQASSWLESFVLLLC